MNKKGSHVGFVLSFVLFITFIVFIYIIIVPSTKRFDESSEVISEIKGNVLTSISEEIYIVRTYDDINVGGCIQYGTPEGLATEVISIDGNGNEVHSSIVGSDTIIEGGRNFVISYYGGDFDKTLSLTPAVCASAVPGNILFEGRIIEGKIISLINELESDYSQVKSDLDIPVNQEFDIQFLYSNGTLFDRGTERKIKTNIYSRQFDVSYISLKGKEEVGKLIIKVW